MRIACAPLGDELDERAVAGVPDLRHLWLELHGDDPPPIWTDRDVTDVCAAIDRNWLRRVICVENPAACMVLPFANGAVGADDHLPVKALTY